MSVLICSSSISNFLTGLCSIRQHISSHRSLRSVEEPSLRLKQPDQPDVGPHSDCHTVFDDVFNTKLPFLEATRPTLEAHFPRKLVNMFL
ncbi:Protein of unknown function [Pyronema omphalodes CBS 100304]|uniref:Uncharacterized protein n=1 Tax=Pyronema omphalodes (strain CBS 100304) TaxID=1076935 RepID=U4LVC2_PYROM|nr:Protein of unknown function [Pyronema omphalodes CBS 100304]